MKSQEIYKRFLLELNKNDSNEGVNILPSSFVLLFNTERFRWLEQKLESDADNWKLQHLDNLLVVDKQLTKQHEFSDAVEFAFPEDFFRHAYSFSIADKGACKGERIYNFEKKALGFHTVLADDFSSPQFEYRETPFIITQNNIRVFFEGFKIQRVYASYYRLPKPIDIAGYTKFDGSASVDLETDLIEDQIDEIIERVVKRVAGQVGDVEKHQVANERIVTEP